MRYTKCSNCGGAIPNGTKAYIGIDSARGDVFCSKDCVVRYITSGEMVYVDSETDGELNWFEAKNNNQNSRENKS